MKKSNKLFWSWIIFAILVIFFVPDPYDVLLLIVSLFPYLYFQVKYQREEASKK